MNFQRMKTVKLGTTLVIVAALAVAGCADGQNQGGATLGGAALGGLLGSQFGRGDGRLAMTALGTLAGAAIGNNIGRKMDDVDRMKMRDAEKRAYAAPINEIIIWNNPNSGNSGTVKAIRDGRRTTGEYCREFQSEINVGGQREKAYGTACQQPDGSWKIVSG